MDFKVIDNKVFAVSNTNKLVCINNGQIVSQITTGTIGKKIDVYEIEQEYLIAVLFTNYIKIYTMNKETREIVPCYNIDGRYSFIGWIGKYAKLLVSSEGKSIIIILPSRNK